MAKLNAIAVAVMFLASIFAGAFSALALDPVHQVPVSAYDANGAKLTVDIITVYDEANKEVGLARNVQTHTFLLSTGKYTIVAAKAGYESADAWVPITVNSPAVMQTVALKLTAVAGTGGTGDGGVEPQPGTTSTDVYVKDISFDEDAKPAQNVEFEFEVKNVAGYEAEDVEATLIVVGLDDGDDVEVEDIRVGDVEKDDTAEDIKAVLTVPVKADEGKYTVKVHLTWEDRDGKEYRNLDFVATDKLNIERAEHDVQITKLRLSAETLQPGTEGEIGITLMNIGENDEKVKVRVQSEKLGISETSAEFKVEEGDEVTQYIPFTVSEDAEDGKYFIYVTATFNNGADEMLQFTTVDIRAAGPVTGAAPVTVTPTVTTTGDEKAGWTAKGLLIAVVVLIGVAAVLAKEYAPKRPVVISTSRRGRR